MGHPVTGTVAVHTTGVLSATGACSTDWALPPIRRRGPQHILKISDHANKDDTMVFEVKRVVSGLTSLVVLTLSNE